MIERFDNGVLGEGEMGVIEKDGGMVLIAF